MTRTNNLSINQARRESRLAFVFLILLCLSLAACEKVFDDSGSESELTAKVIKIKDGDSLILAYSNKLEQEARLHGIDAPEYTQPYGKDAKRILSQLISNDRVRVKIIGRDKYQRDLVVLYTKKSDININQQLIEKGAAWVFRDKAPEWDDKNSLLKTQSDAKANKKGLWSLRKPIAPWEWRDRNR